MKTSTPDMFEGIPDSNSKGPGRPEWLGMVIDNRRLFDALQDGWLHPGAPRTDMVVGVESFDGTVGPFADNRIPVWLRLDTAKLPDLDVNFLRDNQWRTAPLSHVMQADTLALWPGVLPATSIRDISVACDEHRVRLKALAERVSNITLPDVLTCDVERNKSSPEIPPLPEPTVGIAIPESYDGIRGAMTMALWAVPKIDTWLDLLVASLTGESGRLTKCAKRLNASWWRFPPWSRLARSAACGEANPNDVQERLWLAAIDALGTGGGLRSIAAVDAITQSALREDVSEEHRRDIVDWQQATHQVQRAEASIQHEEWRCMPVGLAIQLLLARPEPADFKTWLHDNTQPSPAVAWTAATLCGLLHGYRRLDLTFRGSLAQQETIAVQALRMSTQDSDLTWPAVTKEAPRWRKETGKFNKYVLFWGGQDFAEKRERERGQWFAADFDDPEVQQTAIALANQMDWDCVDKAISLTPGTRTWSGSKELEAADGKLKVHGLGLLGLLPEDQLVEVVNPTSFLRRVAEERGRLPAPPSPATRDPVTEDIPGFALIRDFITEREEREIVQMIDETGQWSSELSRRVQHYGWRYDYRSRRIDETAYLGPLPEWAGKLGSRLFENGHVSYLPNQVIVNEYVSNQGITAHIDSSAFADGVAMISLLETWEMDFIKGRRKVVRKLERRSAVVLLGDARYKWKHGIRKRQSEPANELSGGKRIPRGRRVSLTFRKVLAERDVDSSRKSSG